MKNVFLIGDSIRVGADGSPGYEVFVREALRGKATVFSSQENSRFAEYTLRGLFEWAREVDGGAIDIVHWNNGLWDLLRLDGDEPLTPLPVYLAFLERIYRKLRLYFPQARIIFALTTPVLEERCDGCFRRYNSEICTYNAAAAALLTALGAEIDDLYRAAQALPEEAYAGAVHFTEEGCRVLAEAVVRALRVD